MKSRTNVIDYKIASIENISYEEYLVFCDALPELSQKISSLVFYKDKLRSAYAYYLTKEIASKRLGCSIYDLEIDFTANFKPFFRDCLLHFNISHSDEYVASAIDEHPLGIDIEKIVPFNIKDFDYVLTADELDYILAAPNELEKQTRLCYVWTFKEAYQKMNGVQWMNYQEISMFNNSHLFKRIHLQNYIVTICSPHLSL